jgi:crossover junction endodeoxyribonuclease RuvC
MIVVGLDMSLVATGVCIKRDASVELHTIKTKPKDFPNDLERLRHIVDETLALIPADGPDLICVEDFFTPSKPHQIGSAIKLIGLGMILRDEMYQRKFPFIIVAPTQLKKFVSGHGRFPKDQITKEIFKKWKIDASDNNQADACGLGYLADVIYRLKTGADVSDCRKYELDVAKKVLKGRPSYNS